ncbi:MAG: type II CAAX endopeptidase family protein [Proteobacteria bacterium]|nr:type II CAAX endopeptidase family protein [Pseudomonadota bacterium]
MKNIFLNPETGLLRAGWRILAFFAIFMTITAVGMVSVRTILGSLRKGSDLQFSILAVTATAAVYIARRYLDKKTLVSLGLRFDRYALLDIVSGVLNSALLMASVYFCLLWSGLIEFQGFSWWTDTTGAGASFQLAIVPVVLLVLYKLSIVAWWEELVFRGYLLQNMIAGMGLTASVVLASLIFGFGHGFNPDATLLSSVLIALITPQLIYAYLKTGQLWLPMGLHLGWNFFQASVFGFASSGQESPSLIAQVPVGPEWLSGGAFGAEGSVLIVPFTVLSMVLIHYWVRATRQRDQGPFEWSNPD